MIMQTQILDTLQLRFKDSIQDMLQGTDAREYSLLVQGHAACSLRYFANTFPELHFTEFMDDPAVFCFWNPLNPHYRPIEQ